MFQVHKLTAFDEPVKDPKSRTRCGGCLTIIALPGAGLRICCFCL